MTSDTDGLKDGEEIYLGQPFEVNRNYITSQDYISFYSIFHMKSNPLAADSDDDGITDKYDAKPLVANTGSDMLEGGERSSFTVLKKGLSQTFTIASNEVPLRSTPNKSAFVVGVFDSGTTLKVTAVVYSKGTYWMKTVSSGIYCYVEYTMIRNGDSFISSIAPLFSIDESVFWCQTGGWWENRNHTGYDRCMMTSIATMSSINTNSIVLPTDVAWDSSSVIINGAKYFRSDIDILESNYVFQNGFCLYNFNNVDDILWYINYEISHRRAVVVKTTVAGEHWVTVTGTVDGEPAECFEDFVGVDPWYNGLNVHNPHNANYSSSNNPEYSGIIRLSNVSGQTLHNHYLIVTMVYE